MVVDALKDRDMPNLLIAKMSEWKNLRKKPISGQRHARDSNPTPPRSKSAR
jgi:hypothetical protein